MSTDQPMAPREAADAFERRMPFTSRKPDARALLDHARATSPAPEGGDLAETREALEWSSAELLEKFRRDLAAGLSADASTGFPDLINLVHLAVKRCEDAWARGHRDGTAERITAPAPSVATPPQEGEAVLVARCENYREIEDRPCGGMLRFRWGQSQVTCGTCGACGACGAWRGLAVARWQYVSSLAAPPAEGEAAP